MIRDRVLKVVQVAGLLLIAGLGAGAMVSADTSAIDAPRRTRPARPGPRGPRAPPGRRGRPGPSGTTGPVGTVTPAPTRPDVRADAAAQGPQEAEDAQGPAQGPQGPGDLQPLLPRAPCARSRAPSASRAGRVQARPSGVIRRCAFNRPGKRSCCASRARRSSLSLARPGDRRRTAPKSPVIARKSAKVKKLKKKKQRG